MKRPLREMCYWFLSQLQPKRLPVLLFVVGCLLFAAAEEEYSSPLRRNVYDVWP